jgi:diaminopimelate epimerase
MKNFSFVKMSGAGNDFILFDKKINPSLALNPSAIKSLCDRHNGIGADGIITINDSEIYDFEMEYFNANGSTGSLCGNGSRCAIKFAESSGRIKNGSASFISNRKKYTGQIIDDKQIKFFLNAPEDLRLNFNISVSGLTLKVNYLNTGSPHVVININDIPGNFENEKSFYTNIDEVPVIEIGSEIRYLEDFAPEGTNVNFISLDHQNLIIRTYERGVENETLSCGTGAVAAAIIASINYEIKPPVNLLTKGNNCLIVDFKKSRNRIENLSLTGPVELIFTGEVQGTIFDE